MVVGALSANIEINHIIAVFEIYADWSWSNFK